MANIFKRYPRTRTTRQICQEKFACDGENSEAQYVCDSCATVQCGACEANIHLQRKYVHHDRHVLPSPPLVQLCQSKCPDKNYADVVCAQCSLRYCDPCYDKVHTERTKKLHQKKRFKYTAPTVTPVTQDSIDNQASDEFVDATSTLNVIQPLSPVGVGENSLTYLSMPQACGEEFGMHSSKRQDLLNTFKVEGAFSRTPPDVDLFAEDPTFQELNELDIPFVDTHSTSNGTVKMGAHSDSHGSSGTEDSEPESSRHSSVAHEDDIFQSCKSFPLADQSEKLEVQSEEELIARLGCDAEDLVKVISIFGNTGDGKSHTLNYTFFGGREVFKTSPSPLSCTTGVWAAFDPVHNAVIIDTEGLLGISPNHNQRTRLLLKVLAISDIVIYRTRAERLHNDLFQFLADASKAYSRHFTEELKAAAKRNQMDLPMSTLGPTVLVFHETQHTDVIGKKSSISPDEMIRKRFEDLGLGIDAFSSVHYIGTQTLAPPTDFKCLLLALKNKLRDTSVRSPRKPAVIYNALQTLNDKFNGEIEKSLPETFPDQYFTCRSECLSCKSKCSQGMNHLRDDIPHNSDKRCCFRYEYENKLFMCKKCFESGQEVIVVPKTSPSSESSWFGLATFVWSGYVLECPSCGVIYRSRQYWYGNENPDKSVVHTEIRHVWPDSNPNLQGTHNAARRLLDGFHYMSETVASVGAKPTKMVTNWVTDQIAPPYWVPNSQITNCFSCKKHFDEQPDIHHCRACGQGFCDDCSTNRRRVPERGWGELPVRVCDKCYADSAMSDSTDSNSDAKKIIPRKVGEVIGSTVGTVASFVNYPLDVLRDSARPNYWKPDAECKECHVCRNIFSLKLRIHHCRCCGEGVCNNCSQTKRTVPSRGWDYPVRVCDKCCKKKTEL